MKKIFTLTLIAMFSVCCYAQQPKSEPVLKYRMDSMVLKLYNEYTGEYENNSLRKYIYNEDQQVVSDIWCFWGLTWYDVYKDEYFYNTDKQLDSILNFRLDDEWIGQFKTYLNYFQDGRLQSRISYQYLSNSWVPDNILEYQYFNDSTIEYSSYYSQQTWVPGYKTIYEYANGVLSVETRFLPDMYGNFLNFSRILYEYQDGNVIRSQYTGVDYMCEWLPYISGKEEYIYDENNNLERYTSYSRMDETSDWIINIERVNTYDNQFSGEDLIIPSASLLNPLNYRHMLLNCQENNNSLDYNILYVPKYNPVMVEKVKSIVALTANAYPNPAKDNITIKWESPLSSAEISIYDITGSLIRKMQIDNNSTIPVSDLSNGLHLYTLSSDGNVIGSGKFVVGR